MPRPEYSHLDAMPDDDPPNMIVVWKTSQASPNNHFAVAHFEDGHDGKGWRIVLHENKPCGGKATVVADELIPDCPSDRIVTAFEPLGDEWIEVERDEDPPFTATRFTVVVSSSAATVVELSISHDAQEGQPTTMEDEIAVYPLTVDHLASIV